MGGHSNITPGNYAPCGCAARFAASRPHNWRYVQVPTGWGNRTLPTFILRAGIQRLIDEEPTVALPLLMKMQGRAINEAARKLRKESSLATRSTVQAALRRGLTFGRAFLRISHKSYCA